MELNEKKQENIITKTIKSYFPQTAAKRKATKNVFG